MEISDKALEAAAKVEFTRVYSSADQWDEAHAVVKKAYMDTVREEVEAAAPFIAAQALRDAADGIGGQPGRGDYYQGMDAAAASLHDRADELDPS